MIPITIAACFLQAMWYIMCSKRQIKSNWLDHKLEHLIEKQLTCTPKAFYNPPPLLLLTLQQSIELYSRVCAPCIQRNIRKEEKRRMNKLLFQEFLSFTTFIPLLTQVERQAARWHRNTIATSTVKEGEEERKAYQEREPWGQPMREEREGGPHKTQGDTNHQSLYCTQHLFI